MTIVNSKGLLAAAGVTGAPGPVGSTGYGNATTVLPLSTNYTFASSVVTGNSASNMAMKAAYPHAVELQKGWREYKIASNDYTDDQTPVRESPINGKVAHISSLTIGRSSALFHWNVFRRLFPEIKYFMIGIGETIEGYSSVAVSNVAFLDTRDGEMFEQWLADYQRRFGSRENLYSYRFPPPPHEMSQCFTAKRDIAYGADDIDIAMWMVKQCAGGVYQAGPHLLFEDQGDAVAFKLKFS